MKSTQPQWHIFAKTFSLATTCLVAMLLLAGPTATQELRHQGTWTFWGPGNIWREHWTGEKMSPAHQHRMQRHWTFMNGNIPEAYKNLKNPLDGNEQAIGAGKTLYNTHCARCHGDNGLGNGKAGYDLYPSPALLAYVIHAPISVDSYLMWTVAEGGKNINSEMPGFKTDLSREEIWQVITYMRFGFARP